MPFQNFQSADFRKKFQTKVPLFLQTPEFRYNSAGLVERTFHAKNQINPNTDL